LVHSASSQGNGMGKLRTGNKRCQGANCTI
jgi:hypothetical protein